MIEFQLAGCFDTAHERLDGRAILRQQRRDVGAGNHLFGVRSGKAIERLVQIHDQAMQAVAAAVRQAGEAGDLRKLDSVGAERRRRFDCRQAR